jgi:hypothetical protein
LTPANRVIAIDLSGDKPAFFFQIENSVAPGHGYEENLTGHSVCVTKHREFPKLFPIVSVQRSSLKML